MDDIRESETAQRAGKIIAFALFAIMLLSPRPDGLSPEGWRLAAVAVLMAALWSTQAIPIAATSLIPLVAFPALGIQGADVVAKSYISREIFLFFGGFIIALGIEKWDLHRRIALRVVLAIGTSPRRVVLGFMVATGFISMWISNTASTLMMLPIALAMVTSLREVVASSNSSPAESAKAEKALTALGAVLMLGVAYASSIGGFTTLVGTPTNVAFRALWTQRFPDSPEISSGPWMMVAGPIGAVFLLIAWGALTWRLPRIPGAERYTRSFFADRLRSLGRASAAERRISIIFAATALLWVFRKSLELSDSIRIPGWEDGIVWLVGQGFGDASGPAMAARKIVGMIDDSTVAIAMALLLFFIPSGRIEKGRTQFLMDWQSVEQLPWGVLILFGGGLALAGGFTSTGLSVWMGNEFARSLGGQPPWVLVGGVCLLMIFLTEFTSNVATINATLPVLMVAAVSLKVDPRLIAIPATIATSCGFMLPAATPPNAIVFSSGHLRIGQMVRAGILLNLISIVLLTAATFALIAPAMNISLTRLPDWAAAAAP